MYRLFVCTLVLFIAACGSASENARLELNAQQHYQRWSEQPQSYTVTFQQQCFCMPDYLRPIQLAVENNQIVDAIFANDQSPVPAEIISDLPTIEKMFHALEAAKAIPAERIDAEFDPQFHYPSKIYIDYDAQLADEEVHWQLSNFVPKVQ